MTLLVTGAGGFVGLNILENRLSAGERVVALVDRPLFPPAARAFAELPGELELVFADVRSRPALRECFAGRGVTQVIHAAAITLGPAAAIAPAETVVDVNVLGTRNVIEAAIEAGIRRVVYPSSSAVYGTAPFRGRPVDEAAETRPTGLYGFTKLAAERLMMAAAEEQGLEAAVGRVTAVFGPWEHATGVRETLSPPFQLASRAMAGLETRLPSGGARDWTSSRDVAAALLALADTPQLPSRVYNISAGETWAAPLLAEALRHRLGKVVATVADDAEGDLAFNDDLSAVRSPIDASRIREELGVTFASPSRSVDVYADWVIAAGPGALG